MLFAPAFLIIVLIGLGAYFAYVQRSNQAAVDALVVGPVLQAETVADFSTTAWTAQVHLYRLMATAANENDQKKIKTLSAQASSALSEMAGKFKALENLKFDNAKTTESVGKLGSLIATYTKQARGVIEMADGDSGSALMLMTSAARSFSAIEKLIDDLTETSKDVRDRKIAINNVMLEQQEKALFGGMLLVVVLGCVASFVISRGITKPIVGIAGAIKLMGAGNFDMVLPGLGRKDEIGDIAAAVEALKLTAIEKARREADEVAARQMLEAEAATRQQKIEAEIQAKAAEERAKAAEEQARVLHLLASGLKRLADGDLTVSLDDRPFRRLSANQGRFQRHRRPPAGDDLLDRGGRRARSPTPRPRSRPARPTCRSAPRSRPPAWKRPPPRWRRSPRP